MVEAVGVVVGTVGLAGLAELVRRSVVGGRFERSLAVQPVRQSDHMRTRPGA